MTRRLLVGASAALVLFTGTCAYADIIGTEDHTKFGDLDQHDVTCGGTDACGPTAATNSFVFLENSRPDLYGTSLTGGFTMADLIGTADNLQTSAFMGSCSCGENGDESCAGTYIEDFIIGKQNYIDHYAPGTTTYEAQMFIPWLLDRSPNPQPHTTAPKPDYVQDDTTPTVQFIADQLEAQQDVEVFLGFAGGAHYVTLTDIDFDPTTDTGTIGYIDPDDGLYHQVAILGFDTVNDVNNNPEEVLQIDYAGTTPADIFATVAESPVPEPGTFVLLGAGIGLVLLSRRRKAAR